MQVTVSTTEGLGREMQVQVPAEKFQTAFDKRIDELSTKVKIDGFRKGKVPLKVVKQRYAAEVTGEVTEEIVKNAYLEALESEKLNPAGMPHFHPEPVKLGEDISFKATFEVYPEVKVADMSKVKVQRPVTEVSDADVTKVIDNLRDQHADWKTVSRKAKNDDQVVMDFVGKVDDEPFDGGKAEKYPLKLGSNSMIPGFEEQVIGIKAGDSKEIKVDFPEDYRNVELAGKAAVFDITAHEVQEKELAEVNDEFAAKALREGATVADLESDVKKHLANELVQHQKAVVKKAVMDAMLEKHKFDVPNSLVDQEIEVLAKQAMQKMGIENVDSIDPSKLPREPFEEEAKRRVSLGLLLAEIIKEQNITADADKVKETIETLSKNYDQPEEVVKYYYSNQQMMQNVQSMVIEDQVVEWVLESGKVSDKKVSFDELVELSQQGQQGAF